MRQISILFLLLFFNYSYAQTNEVCAVDQSMNNMIEQNPNYQSLLDSYNQNYLSALPTQNNGQGENNTYEIPIVFHVYHNYGPENISDDQIHQAVEQLNDQFSGKEGGFDTKITFHLATLNPYGQCSSGINRVNTELGGSISYYNNVSLMALSQWPVEKYLNAYIVKDINPPFVAGYAYLPPAPEEVDGIVIKHDRLGTTGTASNNHLNTLSHEIGHYLSLLHVWGDRFLACEDNCHSVADCTTHGDMVCDTNPAKQSTSVTDCSTPAFGCTDCPIQNLDLAYPADNYMSYAHSCQDKFTAGQAQRMWYALNEYRSELWSNENQLCTGITNHFGHNITITQDETWTIESISNGGDGVITGSLTVEPGATLIIEEGVVLRFCENGKVVIKQGGTILNKGTFTSACNAPWQGVEVWGTTSAPQGSFGSNQNHGFYIGQHRSLIENALIGVKLHGPDYLSDGGGMISCNGAKFNNCTTSILYAPYDLGASYKGSIGNCIFTNDGSFLPFESFIDLNDVKGINITGSSFTYTGPHTGGDIEGYGYGIWAKNSGFKLNSIVNYDKFGNPIGLKKCSFNGLGYGIWIANLFGNKYYEIKQATFTNNYVGIYNNGMSLGKILFNDFNYGSVPDPTLISADDKAQIGVMLNNHISGITFQQNDFNGTGGSSFNEVGTYCNRIGTHNNVIKKNNFTNLSYANLAEGKCSTGTFSNGYSSGLLYMCNVHHNNLNDITLVNTQQDYPRIKRKQRRILDYINDEFIYEAAGNTFSQNTAENGNLFNPINLNHEYHYNPNVQEEIPVAFSNGWTIFEADENTICSEYICEPPCPIIDVDIDPGIVNGPITPASIKNQYLTIKELYDYLTSNHIPYPYNPITTEASISPSRIEKFSDLQQVMDPLITAGMQLNLADPLVFDNVDYYWWLNQLNSYEADLWLAFEYASSGNFNQSDLILNSITNKWNLDYNDVLDFNNITVIYNILKFENWAHLSENNINTVISIYNENLGYASDWAATILNANGIKNPIKYTLPTISNRKENEMNFNNNKFEIHPNPATNFVKLTYADKDFKVITFKISDLNGRNILSKSINSNTLISISDLETGVYLYTIENNKGEVLKSERLMIIH